MQYFCLWVNIKVLLYSAVDVMKTGVVSHQGWAKWNLHSIYCNSKFYALFLLLGHVRWPVWCLAGSSRGTIPIQPVGPVVEASRGGRPGRLQLVCTGQHRPLDRPGRRCLWRRYQGVLGPLSRRPAVQPLQLQTVNMGQASRRCLCLISMQMFNGVSHCFSLCECKQLSYSLCDVGKLADGLWCDGAFKPLRAVYVLFLVLMCTFMCLFVQRVHSQATC